MALDLADLDPTVDPGVDFYRHANGGWAATHSIPAGYGAWGAFEEINARNEQVLLDLLHRAADGPSSALERALGDYFASGMDLDAIEAAGLTPVQSLLAAAASVVTPDDLRPALLTIHEAGIFPLFGWSVSVDFDDATRHQAWVFPAGLGLPDRDSYFAEDETGVDLRAAYVAHVAAQLANVGYGADEARQLAPQVLAFETRLAEQHLRSEEKRDPDRILNRHDLDALQALAPELDLTAYLHEVGAGSATNVNVPNPAYFTALPGILAETDEATLRAYLTFQVVMDTADALPRAIDDEAFTFYGRRVLGKQEQLERSKRVVAALTDDMGEALSELFVAATFPPGAKERALAMVQHILEEMGRSLETREWMTEQTRQRAHEKLAALGVKIGYPDKWRDWSELAIDRSSYAANRLRAARFEMDRQLRKLDEPVDPDEWEMPPHVVNAYYHPLRNEIVFPAGILQPPMFDAEADDALNYGGIGAVIGHEVTHGFDDQGRRYDADGAFRDWWTPEDEERFNALADRLVEQFDAYEVVDGLHVNGRLTLGENIADLGGLSLAQRAHAQVSQGTAEIDGLSPGQRFFLANATVWRSHNSDQLKSTLVQMDPHSPRPLRVNGPLSNLDSFAAAFDLDEDAPMMRARDQRIEIW